MARKRKLKINPEVLIGVIFLIILIGLGLFVYSIATRPPPSEEVCDLKDNDYDGEIDEGFSVTCREDVDCGPSGTYGEKYCRNGKVYQDGIQNTCRGKLGSCQSECRSAQEPVLIQTCKNDCENGRCVAKV